MQPLSGIWKQQKRIISESPEHLPMKRKRPISDDESTSGPTSKNLSHKRKEVAQSLDCNFSNTFSPEDLLLIEEFEQNNNNNNSKSVDRKSFPNGKVVASHSSSHQNKHVAKTTESRSSQEDEIIIVEDDDDNDKPQNLDSSYTDYEEPLSPAPQNSQAKSNEPSPASSVDPSLLCNWGLPWSVLQKYSEHGITSLFQWQIECLTLGKVLQGGNLVYSAPTSAGKTLVAEILLLKRVLETKKKAILILPFVSVAREKMFYLQRLFQGVGIRVSGYIGTHYPPGGWKRIDVAVCTIEKANGLINRLLEEKKLHEIGILVIDELHMLGDSSRGYLLELLLTKVQYMSWKSTQTEEKTASVQIIGMSATLPNLDMLSSWLKADLYKTDFRPVPLTEHVKVGNIVYNRNFQKVRELQLFVPMTGADSDHVIQMCLETISEKRSVLVFCPSKSWCESLANTVAKEIHSLGNYTPEEHKDKGSSELHIHYCRCLHDVLKGEDLKEVLEQLKRTPAGLDPVLSRTICFGVAFHHAGLTTDERDIIESAFRRNIIRVLIATSTLSSGVNLPARRVIVRSPLFCGELMDVLAYRQMIGRAGRKGIDTEGESFLICKANELDKVTNLIHASLKPIKSCLIKGNSSVTTASMKRAMLEIVVSGVATSPEEIQQYYDCTLLAASLSSDQPAASSAASSPNLITICLQFLMDNEFIILHVMEESDGTERKKYIPTPLGSAVMASSLSVDEGLIVFRELDKARKCFVLENELHTVYLVTPLHISEQWSNMDWLQYLSIWEQLPTDQQKVGELVGVEERFLVRLARLQNAAVSSNQYRQLAIHRRFFTALALHDLVNEVPLDAVSKKFNCNKGMLQSLQQSSSTFAGMVTSFCNRLGWINLEILLNQFQSRLNFGIQRELCDLVRLSLLNGQRARLLYDGGFKNVSEIAHAQAVEIEIVLRHAGPFNSKKQRDSETDHELQERNKARYIWLTGQKGLTETEAAILLVEEARQIVERELGVNIQWEASKTEENIPSDLVVNSRLENVGKESHPFTLTGTPSESQDEPDRTSYVTVIEPRISCNSMSTKSDKSAADIRKETLTKDVQDEAGSGEAEVIDLTDDNLNLVDRDKSPGKVSAVDASSNNCAERTDTCRSAPYLDASKELAKEAVKAEPNEAPALEEEEDAEDEDLREKSKTCPVDVVQESQFGINGTLEVDTQMAKLIDGNISELGNVTGLTPIKRRSSVMPISSPFLQGESACPLPKSSTPYCENSTSNRAVSEVGSDADKRRLAAMMESKCVMKLKENANQDVHDFSGTSNGSINLFDSPPTSPVVNEDEVLGDSTLALESSDEEKDYATGSLHLESLSDDEEVIPSSNANYNASSSSTLCHKICEKKPSNGRSLEAANLSLQKEARAFGKHLVAEVDVQEDLYNADEAIISADDTVEPVNVKPRSKRQKIDVTSQKNKIKEKNLLHGAIEINNNNVDADFDFLNKWKNNQTQTQKKENQTLIKPIIVTNLGSNNMRSPFRKLKRQPSKRLNQRKYIPLTYKSSESQHISDCDSDEAKPLENKPIEESVITSQPNILQALSNSPPVRSSQTSFHSHFFSIVDTCLNDEQFTNFINKWKSKRRFSVSVACERLSTNARETIGSKILGQNNPKSKETQNCDTSLEGKLKKMKVVGLAVYWDTRNVYYTSLTDSSTPNEVPITKRISSVQKILNSTMEKAKELVAYNFKEQFRLLFSACGIFPQCKIEDPKIASWLLDPTCTDNNFYQLISTHCEDKILLLEKMGGRYCDWGGLMPAFSSKAAMLHSCTDAFLSLSLMNSMQQTLREKHVLKVFQDVEMKSLQIVLKMELVGIGFNTKHYQAQLELMQKNLRALESEAFRLAGHKFSLTSLKDVSKVLYMELKLHLSENKNNSVGNNKPRKNLRTNHAALVKLSAVHPLPEIIIQWRKLSNSLSKVVLPLLKETRESPSSLQMSRIHGTYQFYTATGRIAMCEPNLQAIPKTFSVDRKLWDSEKISFNLNQQSVSNVDLISLREAFVPFEGGVLVSADYSQLELRILAHLSGDPILLNILNNDGDVFKMVAAQLKGCSVDLVTPDERQSAKQICYGIIYGIGAKSLGEELKIDEEDAAVFMENFKSKFPGVKSYLQDVIENCEKIGYVETLTKRRRYLPMITSDNSYSRASAQRQAVNTTIQGSAADLVKTAIIEIDRALGKKYPSTQTPRLDSRKGKEAESDGGYLCQGGRLVLQIHDELLFEIRKEDMESVVKLIKNIMENVARLKVKMRVNMFHGPSWANLQPLNVVQNGVC